jgi:hypothetical protein
MTPHDVMLLLHIQGLRHGAWLVQRVRQQIARLTRGLVAALHELDLPRTRRQAGAALGLGLPILGDLVHSTYVDIAEEMQDESGALAVQHMIQLVADLNTLEDTPTPLRAPSANVVLVAVAQTLFPSSTQGTTPSATATEWWRRQAVKVTQAVSDQVRAGTVAGESDTQLTQRLTGTRALQYRDGLMSRVSRAAEVVAQAQAAMAPVQGTVAVARANRTQVTALQHSSIMDERTTDICRARDGKQWTSDTQAPIGHTLPFLPPPCHFGCRSMLLLVLVDAPVMVEAAQPLRAFVVRQSVREQRAMLGTAAFRAWEAGALDETALVQALTRRALPFETHEGAIV